MTKKGILLHLAHVNRVNEKNPFELEFIKTLRRAGVEIWQHLPVNPPGKYDSPYSALSSFAGDLNLLSPNLTVDYSNEDFEKWKIKNSDWVFDWALFNVLKTMNNNIEWFNWPAKFKNRNKSALNEICEVEKAHINKLIKEQYFFDKKWTSIKNKANAKGISLFGDLPFYVALDSADVWANPELFDLDEKLKPRKIAGVPPDYFSKTGQIWENPLYKWKEHKKEGYKWWQRRIEINKKRFDLLRIDHFRAIVSGWCIEYGSENAINGYWRRGPGHELLDKITEVIPPRKLIAEDLGLITKPVRKLIEKYNLMGMKVLQFGYNSNKINEHHHTNITKNNVCYIGSHDNNTVVGWYDEMILNNRKTLFLSLLKKYNIDKSNCSKKMIEIAINTNANYVVITIQDLMNLGSDYRINIPGKNEGNWKISLDQDDIFQADWDFIMNL